MKIRTLTAAALLLVGAASTAPAAGPKEATPEEMDKIRAAVPAAAPAKAAKPRRVLVFSKCEGFVHDSIPCGNEAMKLLGQKTGAFQADVSDDMAVFSAENLKKYDAVLLNNTTRLGFPDPAQRAALLEFIKGGKGLVGIHAATDNFYNWDEAAAIIGGQFDGHPWGAGGTWGVKLDDPKHPLNASFDGRGFLITDEIYKIKGAYSRKTHRVLLSLDMAHPETAKTGEGKCRPDNDHPIAWIDPCEKGRVFYCSLGHNKHIYWDPKVMAHYLAGIQYALGDYKVDDRPTAEVVPALQPAPYRP